MATPTTTSEGSQHPDYCECCRQVCTDDDRAKWANRFSTFQTKREKEWAVLSESTPPLRPGEFQFTKLPREIRDKIYNHLIRPKTGVGRYVTHDHQFPTQILYLDQQIRDEFLGTLFERIWVMCQYSTHPKHVELLLPPPTLFPRVRSLWARIIVADNGGSPLPSWETTVHDTAMVLSMFPNLGDSSLLFRGVYGDNKTLEEADVVKVWDESEIKGIDFVKVVAFEIEGPREGVPRGQWVHRFEWRRKGYQKGGEWKESESKKEWKLC